MPQPSGRYGCSPCQCPPRPSLEARARSPAKRSLADKPLHSTSVQCFGNVEAALRVDRDAVRRFELARPAAALAEARDDLERVAKQRVNLMGAAIDEEDESLLGITGHRDIPRISPDLAPAQLCVDHP